jgi:hypothetical protein
VKESEPNQPLISELISLAILALAKAFSVIESKRLAE